MTVYPNLGYRDAQAAIRFLVKAFGFHRAYAVEDGEGGPIAHARDREQIDGLHRSTS